MTDHTPAPPFTMSKYASELDLLRAKCAWLERELAEAKGSLEQGCSIILRQRDEFNEATRALAKAETERDALRKVANVWNAAFIESSDEAARVSAYAEARGALLQEWLDTELDPEDEEYTAWIEQFTKRVHAALARLPTQPAEVSAGASQEASGPVGLGPRDDALTEQLPRASSACPHCGVDTPHAHDADDLRAKYLDSRKHQLFESSMALNWKDWSGLLFAYPELRVESWGMPEVWARRDVCGRYIEPKIDAAWGIWDAAFDEALKPHTPPPHIANLPVAPRVEARHEDGEAIKWAIDLLEIHPGVQANPNSQEWLKRLRALARVRPSDEWYRRKIAEREDDPPNIGPLVDIPPEEGRPPIPHTYAPHSVHREQCRYCGHMPEAACHVAAPKEAR